MALNDNAPSSNEERRHSAKTLMPRVYDELRRLAAHKMAQERSDHTLTGTALLHEAYLRLNKEGEGRQWANQRQFFSAAAEAMRRILIDRARAKRRLKRGAEYQRADLSEADVEAPRSNETILAVNEALEEMNKSDPDSAELVRMRFFAGLTLKDIADCQGVSVRTITRQWTYARAWILDHLSRSS